jgi:light-regulated signal transduction histidine kinase (bacteriophytochrome)
MSKLPILRGNAVQLSQLFHNLIENSLKYSSEKRNPEINITCKNIKKGEAEFWQFNVSDNGIGFQMEDSKKIFELFQRLHKKDKYEGTGIGLTICKKIIENHKGSINVHSAPEEGTTFEILIPKLIKR